MPFKKGNNYGKRFTSDYQPTDEAKSLGKQAKKLAVEEYKDSIIYKTFKYMAEHLDDPDISFKEVKDIFDKAVDMSGFKKDKIDTSITTYTLFEEETERKADELVKRTKKTDKK